MVMTKVEKEALFKEFEKKGVNPSRAAKICDMSQSYFSNCEKDGINEEVAEKLKKRLDIDIAEYAIREEMTAEQTEMKIPFEALPIDEIVKAIAQAARDGVVEGFKLCFGEDMLHKTEAEQ